LKEKKQESKGILRAGTKNRVLEMDIPETGICNLVVFSVPIACFSQES